jgi:hypothetical protein
MKKILIVAIVAIGIMACEKNGPSTPEKEKEVFKSVTVDAIALIGQDQAAIEKRLADAGFSKVTDTEYYNMITFEPEYSARLSTGKQMNMQEDADISEAVYYYGIPDKFFQQDKKDIVASLDKLLSEGKSFSIARVSCKDGKLIKIHGNFCSLLTEKPYQIYSETSAELFKRLPLGESNRFWKGWIGTQHPESPQYTIDEYNDHAHYIDIIDSDPSVMNAAEHGYTASETDSESSDAFFYQILWQNTTEDMKAEMRKSGFSHYYLYHSFAVGHISSFEEPRK